MYLRKILSRPTRVFAVVCCLLISAGLCYGSEGWQQLVSNYRITAIEPYEGGYWFSADGAGALRYESATGKWYRYNKSTGHMNQSQNVNALRIMMGKVWFATDYGMYSCDLNGSNWQQHILPGDYFANWVRDFDANSDAIWVASFSGLYTRPASGGSFTYQDISVTGQSGSKIGYSISASDSLVWIGTDNGLIRYDTSLPLSDPSSRTYFGKDNGFNTGSLYVSCRAVKHTESGLWIGLEEYTPATNPTYCLGGLFHKRGNGWSKYDQNDGLPAAGIHFIHEYGNKIYAGLFHYVNGVDFNGAGLLEMDLQESTMRVLTADNWHIGNNDVRAFYVNGTDTLVGTEQGLYANIAGMKDMTPYDAPEWFSLRNTGNGEILINVAPVGLANAYRVYYSTDHTAFSDSLEIASARDTIRGLTNDQLYYFRVAGINDAGAGPQCVDVLAAYVSDESNRILIVQAFNRKTVQNTYDFVHQHGTALLAHGHGFDSASDDALSAGGTELGGYEMVDWIAGTDETNLNAAAKQAIGTYLMGGGKLFISGSNLQENLSGTGGDPYFYKTFLKAESKKANTGTFSLMPLQEGAFDGFAQIPFGVEGTAVYRVYRPDGFIPSGGAVANLIYTDLDTAANGVAGLQYRGTFATSSQEGALLYLGFPFETIHGDSLRSAFMGSVLDYFGFDATLSSAEEIALAPAFVLHQNYPNPFNAETRISYVIAEDAEVSLDLYDISGRKIRELARSFHHAGEHTLRFRADDLPAGVYIYTLRSGNYRSVRKMVFLK